MVFSLLPMVFPDVEDYRIINGGSIASLQMLVLFRAFNVPRSQ